MDHAFLEEWILRGGGEGKERSELARCNGWCYEPMVSRSLLFKGEKKAFKMRVRRWSDGYVQVVMLQWQPPRQPWD